MVAVGVGTAVVGMAASAVGEGRLTNVGTGVGVRSNESEQPVRDKIIRPAVKATRVRFIISLLWWYNATVLILS
jgi:hypothetical protein